MRGFDVATEGQTVTGEWTMTATEFRARCYRLLDEVAETGREIVITKRGRPVARLRPIRRSLGPWFGRDKDIIKIHGDLDEPLDIEWDAETGKNWEEPLVLGQVLRSDPFSSQRPDCRGDGAGGDGRGD